MHCEVKIRLVVRLFNQMFQERKMKRIIRIALIMSLVGMPNVAFSADQKDLVDKTLEVIINTPEKIKQIESQRKSEADQWKEYDKQTKK
jgi:hypothetical protein